MTEDSNNSDSSTATKTAAMIHPDRVAPDPTEGWRRGSRGALRKSCDTCTSSKTKCQGSIPCDRCKKRRIECKFSKRRRCGPKARAEDEKRPRTGMEAQQEAGLAIKDSPEHKAAMHQQHAGVPHPPSPPLPPIGTIAGLDSSSNNVTGGGGGGGGGGLPVSSPKFGGPITSDSLSGLVELIAPTLSDTGGSGSSASISASINASISSSCHGGGEAAYSHHAAAASGNNRYAAIPGLNAEGVSPFLGGGGTSPRHHNQHGASRGGASNRPAFPPSSSVAAVATLSSLSAAMNHTSRQQPGGGGGGGGGARDSLVAARSAPPSGAAAAGGGAPSSTPPSCPVRDLPARAKSMGDTPGGFGQAEGGGGGGRGGRGVQAGFPEGSMGNTFMRQQDGGSELRQNASSASGAPLSPQQPLPRRGSLPMTLNGRSKTHLKTFMRTVGSLILLPGADAIRSAVFGDAGGGDPEQLPDAPTAADPGSAEDVGVKREGRPMAAEEDSGIVDVFAEACRAEAWAAAAVGAQFSGASEEECKDYQSRAMRALSRCLDAPLPEVASVMLLFCLFWMHSMETRKVSRYFGFAQQVGLELGSLMPEELRHTIAFVACLVTMTLNLDQVGSFSLQVKEQAVWGVSLRDNSCRPGVDPFVLALTALTVACNEMLHDGAGRGGQGAIGTGGLSPRVAPSKVLTDLLTKAAKALEADARDGDRNPEHVLALLHGLRAYTHAARGEAEDAEASGRLMLAIIDRHAAVLHLPLTFTLAEASRRLLAAAAERSSRRAPEGVHVEALGAAVTKLSFARPTQGVKPGAGGVAAAAGGGGGGWCSFGDDILAAFAAAGGRDIGGDVLSEAANDNRDRPRSGSMSPPARRSVRPLSRAVIASQSWQPTTGGAAMPIPSSSAGGTSGRESSASLPRWSGGGAAPAGALSSSSCSSAVHRSVLMGSNAAAAPSDWVDRVRKMPTIASSPRASSPNVVQRMGGNGGGNGDDVRSPSPRQEDNNITSPRSMGMLHPGPMPTAAPNVGVKYMSEPRDNLALLSTVAAPGGYNNPPRRASYEDRTGVERQAAVRQRIAGQPGGGGAADRDGGDDLPPPANPGLTTGMSFDPNRDDGTFQFTLGPS